MFNQTSTGTIIDNCKYTASPNCLNQDMTTAALALCEQVGIVDRSCYYVGTFGASSPLIFPNSSNYTINVWINTNTTAANGRIFSSETAGSTQDAVLLQKNDTNGIKLIIFNHASGVAIQTFTKNHVYSNNAWTMITLRVSTTGGTTTANVYVNSILASSDFTGTVLHNSPTGALGNIQGGGGTAFLQGFEDELSVWNQSLSSTSITLLYGAGSPYNLISNAPRPHITLTPNIGPKGSSVSVNGTGYDFIGSVNILFDGSSIATVPDSSISSGSFTKTVTIPQTTLGIHTVNATQSGLNKLFAIALFNVTKTSPQITLTPSNQKVLNSVSVSGSGFVNQASLLFKLDSKVIPTIPALPKSDNNGVFTGILFNVPQTIAGHHNVNVTDGFNNNATAILNVTSTETISPSNGIVGSTVSVNGYGFLPFNAINIKFDKTDVTQTSNNNICTATGGALTTSGTDNIRTFTSNGTLTITSGSCNIKVLVVAGGGGASQGGAGAGGLISNSSYHVTSQAYSVTVGAGGIKDSGANDATSGKNSIFGQLTAIGGGHGIANAPGSSGGSGAGQTGNGGPFTGGSGTAGQGNKGGDSDTVGTHSSGGGGSGGVGQNTGAATTGGQGGVGTSNSISGASVIYACGGGGGASVTPGGGCTAGDGAGGIAANSCTSGNANTGDGAGGIYLSFPACSGGSGIVIVRYSQAGASMVTTNGNGTFLNAKITVIPSTVNNHIVNSTDQSHSATSTFTTLPSLTISPTSGTVGNTISLNGTGFLGSSQIHVNFGSGIITTNPPFFITDATGSFNNIKITVPGLPVGNYNIKAYDTGLFNAAKAFSITAFSSNAPDPVSDLHTNFINNTSVGLAWSQPNLHKNILSGYQINYTTPSGIPNIILTNNTSTSNTNFIVSGLQLSTSYSFRVGVWTTNSSNPYGNILNIQTGTAFVPQNFTIGNIGTTNTGNINATNSLRIPIQYVRTDTGNSTLLNVIYPNNFNLSCAFSYEFAQTTKVYQNLPVTIYDANYVQSTFQFNNTANEVIQIDCQDLISGVDGKYVLTQTKFPLLQQVDNFRNGTYGTHGIFGALDLIGLVAIIISMIGMNRLSESVGAIFTIIMIGVLGFFHIVQWPSIVISVISLIVMLAITQTRKER